MNESLARWIGEYHDTKKGHGEYTTLTSKYSGEKYMDINKLMHKKIKWKQMTLGLHSFSYILQVWWEKGGNK